LQIYLPHLSSWSTKPPGMQASILGACPSQDKLTICTFWYLLTRVVPDKVQKAVKCVLPVGNVDITFSEIPSKHRFTFYL